MEGATVKLTVAEATRITGGLSAPSKMPGPAYNLPAAECNVGSRLRQVEGSTCQHCYAMEGRYTWRPNQVALYRRLASLDDPRWVDAMVLLIQRRCQRVPYFRWHDSGDLQSVDHLRLIVAVCEQTPAVRHWLPTREYRIVADYRRTFGEFPPNLNVRMSAHMIGGRAPDFGPTLTVSTVSRDGMPGAHACPAGSQGNSCGDCRACWDRAVPHVDYHLHHNLTSKLK